MEKLCSHIGSFPERKEYPWRNIERLAVIQVTGHASKICLKGYDEGNEKEQQQLSNIISMTPRPAVLLVYPFGLFL